jgi:hypothetical protein
LFQQAPADGRRRHPYDAMVVGEAVFSKRSES